MPDEVLPLFDDFLQKLYPKAARRYFPKRRRRRGWRPHGIYGMARGARRGAGCEGDEKLCPYAALCLFYMLLFCAGACADASSARIRPEAALGFHGAGAAACKDAVFLLEHLQLYSFFLLTALFFPFSISPFPTGGSGSPACFRGVGRGGRVAVIFCAVFRLRQPLCEGSRALWQPHDHGPHHALGLRLREHRLLRRVSQPPACPAPREPHIIRQNAPEQSGAFSFSVTL